MKLLAVITARAGSKRLKNKNLTLLNKKPLIYWTIKLAQKISEIKKIVISTDSSKILNVSRKYGLKTNWLRPKKIAKDNSTSEEVVKHAYLKEKEEGFNADAIILLQPTSPFRNLKLIKKAIKIFKKNPKIPLISVSELKYNNKILALSKKKLFLLRNQKKIFLPNGSVFIIDSKQAYKSKNYFEMKMNFIVFDRIKENIDIDTKQDLLLSRVLYKINI